MSIPADITLITNQSERSELRVKGFVRIGNPTVLNFKHDGYFAEISLDGEFAEIKKSGSDGYTMILKKNATTDFCVNGLNTKIHTQSLRFKASGNKLNFAAKYFFESDTQTTTDLIIKAIF